jgi:hypothetical protein
MDINYSQINEVLAGKDLDEAVQFWTENGLEGEWPSRWVLLQDEESREYSAMSHREYRAASWPEGGEPIRIA